MATFQVGQPTGWTGMVVDWAVVRSLPDCPDADPTGVDYLGGGCLLWLGRTLAQADRYVNSSVCFCLRMALERPGFCRYSIAMNARLTHWTGMKVLPRPRASDRNRQPPLSTLRAST